MAKRFVRTHLDPDRLPGLRKRLDSGEFDPTSGEAVWIEEDYCSPPLAMERAEVLNDYFTDITIVEENIGEAAGWQQIDDLPELWEQVLDEA